VSRAPGLPGIVSRAPGLLGLVSRMPGLPVIVSRAPGHPVIKSRVTELRNIKTEEAHHCMTRRVPGHSRYWEQGAEGLQVS
jgi:hypothetical protein